MTTKKYLKNDMANESVSKYKLLSAYGGPGSLMHTKYGSIIISCIEEWGFLKRVIEIEKEGIDLQEEDIEDYVLKQSRLEKNGNIGISNDTRLLKSLQKRKDLLNLKYLALIPDIEVVTHNNKVKSGVDLTIASSFMPKVFADKKDNYKSYGEWYKKWIKENKVDDKYCQDFHPPKYVFKGWTNDLKQDNIILLCEHGHISDFPWTKFLRWRKDYPTALNFDNNTVEIFNKEDCCNNPQIKINSSSANASGFDGKWLKCTNCTQQISLKGLMGVKIKCPGHRPWEAHTGDSKYYSGNPNARKQTYQERCGCTETVSGQKQPKPMKVALTTGNNIYYSRILSSIYLHKELFESDITLEINRLESEKKKAMLNDDLDLAIDIKNKIEELERTNPITEDEDVSDSEKEMIFRHNEFNAFHKKENLLNLDKKHLKVKDVSSNLKENQKLGIDGKLDQYFNCVLRIDNMKITSAQLDFSRVVPIDADAKNSQPKNIFRSRNDLVKVYPVVENFGEGIFFSFNDDLISDFSESNSLIEKIQDQLKKLEKSSNTFNKGAVDFANVMNWQMYLVHTFSHLIMRELEFRCGYPTASLSERIYVSNDDKYKMYGCLIYTAEGAEGSMGGLIAQTRPNNLNNLIKSAVKRATICNSDPLCWKSEGQGLFDLNFASCFSCSLVSETSCEHRNLYLDRKILVDEKNGFFKDIITN
jgi:hypothetical protein